VITAKFCVYCIFKQHKEKKRGREMERGRREKELVTIEFKINWRIIFQNQLVYVKE